jgi:hypothetical protein
VLDRDEWPKLPDDPECQTLLRFINPQLAEIIVVENDTEEIIACIGVYRITHFEHAWISPSYRGRPGVLRTLMRKAFDLVRQKNETFVLCGTPHERVEAMLGRLGGVRLPAQFFGVGINNGGALWDGQRQRAH